MDRPPAENPLLLGLAKALRPQPCMVVISAAVETSRAASSFPPPQRRESLVAAQLPDLDHDRLFRRVLEVSHTMAEALLPAS